MFFMFQMDSNVVISDYAAMDRILKEERAYILNIAKQVKKAGCTLLLIQKSILRDALSDLAIHFFDKLKIMVVKDIEREDIDFVCKVCVLFYYLIDRTTNGTMAHMSSQSNFGLSYFCLGQPTSN